MLGNATPRMIPPREIAAFVSSYRNAPYELENEGARRAAFSAVAKAEQDGYLKGIAALMSRMVTCDISELDPGHWLLCARKGVFSLQTLELGEHRQSLRQTMSCQAAWVPGALTGSVFERAVSEIFPDGEVRRFVQQMLGITLAGLPLEQESARLLWPEGGQWEKHAAGSGRGDPGDLCPCWRHRAADQRGQAPRGPCRPAPPPRRVLLGAPSEDGVLAEAGFKRITGNDTVTVRHLYKERFTFVPQFSVVIATNACRGYVVTTRGPGGDWRSCHARRSSTATTTTRR